MTLFIMLAVLFTLATFAWVLRPLWKTRRLPVAFAITLLALGTGLLYLLVGTPAGLKPMPQQTAEAPPHNMEEAVAQLEAALQRDPNQIEGLRLLGRSYLQLEKPDKARDAFERAVKLAPEDPDILVEAAEARALSAADRMFDETALQWLQAALKVQPMHQRARWFLGVTQRQRGEHAQAASTWESLLDGVDASTADALRPQINAARADAGLPPLAQPASADTANADTSQPLLVRVSITPAVRDRFGNDATVFVIARHADGPPMPVAVEKHLLHALPNIVQLDDEDSPMPTSKLSQLLEVELIARLSASGVANRQDGDVDSKPLRIKLPSAAPVELVIGE